MAIDKAKEKAIEAAVAPVLEKIRADRERVDAELQGFLDYLADNLLYEKATAAEALRLSGIASKSKPEVFKVVIGVTPGVYIKDFQMEIVGRLLRSDCEFTLEEIAEVVGYSHGASLSRAFTTWARLTPARFRERTQASRAAGMEPPDLKFFRTGWALGIEFERADRSELEELMRGVIGLRNLEGPNLPTENPLLVAEEIVLAEEFGRWLIELPEEDRDQGIPLVGFFQTPALFEYLLAQSRVAGREDRQKGLWIAELALESLKGLTWRLSAEEMAHQRIRGWSYLGRARRLTGDSCGAEQAFSEAHRLAELSEPPPSVLAEFSSFLASFRKFQRRWAEALHLAENALSCLGPQGDLELRVETLILVGGIHGFEGRWPSALSHFRRASQRAQGLGNAYLHLSVESHLIWANFKTGNFSEADTSLQKAFGLAKEIRLKSAYPHLHWLEGIGAAERKDFDRAEKALRKASSGFQELDDFNYSAAVTLELAIILAWQGRQAEVFELARSAVPILRELQLNKECLVLVAVLEKAILEQKVKTTLLFNLRSKLGADLGILTLLENEGGRGSAPQEPKPTSFTSGSSESEFQTR